MSKRFKYLLFYLIAFGGVIIFTFGVGELLAYVFVRDQVGIFPRFVSRVSYNGFDLRQNTPNSEYWHKCYYGKWHYRINSKGFRSDKEYTYNKPKGVFRILAIGDSFTMGYEVNKDECFTVVLSDHLTNAGIKNEVINAGVSGYSNAEELVFLEHEGLKYDPDVVVLSFYNNDIMDNIRANLYTIDSDTILLVNKIFQPAMGIRDVLNSFFLYRWLSQNSYLFNFLTYQATSFVMNSMEDKNLKEMDDTNEGATDDKPVRNTPNYLANKLVERMYELNRERGIQFILMDIPDKRHYKQSFPAEYNPEAVSDDYLNMLEMFKAGKYQKQDLYWDGYGHWTPKAHAIAGEKLSQLVQNRMRYILERNL